jgi:pSer/pThr/pTyr-binding forkhead associated (FHA) protein
VQCVDLTGMNKTQITIGQNESCDITIEDPSLEEQHAILQAEKNDQKAQILLVPVGIVQTGYRQLHGEKPIEHGDTFSLGTQEFQYLSDEGE